MRKKTSPAAQKKFDNFSPRHYLHEYYTFVGEENRAILKFFHQAYKVIFGDLKEAKLLELGGGPTIYQLISASKYPVSIHFSEFLEQNLSEVKLWMEDRPEKYSWKEFIKHTLFLEGVPNEEEEITRRENLIRSKTGHFQKCDLRLTAPLGEKYTGYFDVVSMNFVAESIIATIEEWQRVLKNAFSLVRPGGYLVMTTIMGANRYRVGDLHFPAAPINRQMVESEIQKLGFQILLEDEVKAEQEEEQGYEGIEMFLAKRTENLTAI